MQLGSLVLAAVLLGINAFFVAIEFALVKVRTTQLEALASQGRAGAGLALSMRKNLDIWLSACQVGITLASLALGWVGEPAFAQLFGPLLSHILPDTESMRVVSRTGSIVAAFSLMTFLHIVVGEQVPKTAAIARAESTVLLLAWPMRLFAFVCHPAIWVLNVGTRWVLWALGFESKETLAAGEVLGEDELRLIFARSAASGAIAQERAELLERALSMVEKTARHVFVPRREMVCLEVENSLEENVAIVRNSGHAWLPVIRGNLDEVEGVVNARELFSMLAAGQLKTLAQIQRPVLFVPENISLEQLLTEFRRRRKHFAVVVNEHGGTSGLVTLGDVVSELVGNIASLGRRQEAVRVLPGGHLELPGTAQLGDIEDRLGLEFGMDKAEVTTIGGYLMIQLGRVPVVGDILVLNGIRILVAKMDNSRVVTVRIEHIKSPISTAHGGEGEGS
ncbi:MAG: hemolysin family protein [Proteobacteria bacterium]|nr:hemolysin family protein [Cystobacterineae bacterium]MCL2258840.1 hemolysin family protein [Cystobacterineae bacterium]MCL2314778.1 hemolysin family protein [Pseudomonadota bacterium]